MHEGDLRISHIVVILCNHEDDSGICIEESLRLVSIGDCLENLLYRGILATQLPHPICNGRFGYDNHIIVVLIDVGYGSSDKSLGYLLKLGIQPCESLGILGGLLFREDVQHPSPHPRIGHVGILPLQFSHRSVEDRTPVVNLLLLCRHQLGILPLLLHVSRNIRAYLRLGNSINASLRLFYGLQSKVYYLIGGETHLLHFRKLLTCLLRRKRSTGGLVHTPLRDKTVQCIQCRHCMVILIPQRLFEVRIRLVVPCRQSLLCPLLSLCQSSTESRIGILLAVFAIAIYSITARVVLQPFALTDRTVWIDELGFRLTILFSILSLPCFALSVLGSAVIGFSAGISYEFLSLCDEILYLLRGDIDGHHFSGLGYNLRLKI